MKKVLFSINLTLASLAICLLVGCTGSKSQQQRANTYINEWLYGVEYDDYDMPAGLALYEKRVYPQGLCTEVRKGDIVGRNLDWYINRDAAAVIKVNAKNSEDAASLDPAKLVTSRFASLGMAGCNPAFSVDLAKTGNFGKIYETLPFATCDGINENGVYIGVNVTATGETSVDPTRWKTGEWGLGANSIAKEEGKLTCCVTYIVRMVLDHATSVAHAKELIRSINWYEPANFPAPGLTQAFHFLISDAQASTVCEFVDGEVVFVDAEDINQPGYGTIMTNFNNALMAREEPIFQHTGCGYERYDLIRSQYPAADVEAEGKDAMRKMMESVWYSKAYTKEINAEDFWFTENYDANIEKFHAGNLYKQGKEMWKDEDYVNKVKHSKTKFADKDYWHQTDCDLWYTTHTSIYSISNKNLQVLVHEGLDGMDGYYDASFDVHFEKPLELAQ